MKILLFISISLFGLIVFFKSRNKNDNISIYNKINSVEIDKIKSKNNEKENEKTISNTINLPFILHNIIYLKLIIA
ncbi:type II secretion system F family protein, partial [Yersinia enterocolitica]